MIQNIQSQIKVLIVEDDPLFRSILLKGLGSFSNLIVVGSCDDGDQVIEFCSKNFVNVIVMDYNMKRTNGDEATKLVKEKFPHIQIIAHSSNLDLWIKIQMLEAGASCFLPKSLNLKRLNSIIKAIYCNDEKFDNHVLTS